jgi:hypothetical protein
MQYVYHVLSTVYNVAQIQYAHNVSQPHIYLATHVLYVTVIA